MIDQEKILLVEGVAFSDKDDRVLKALEHWEHGTQWQRLDRIQATEEELNEIIDKMCSATDSSSDLIVNPALEEFTVICTDGSFVTTICFRRSIMYGQKFVTRLGNSTVSILVPYIDAYVYMNNNGTRQDVVIALGKSTITNGEHTITCSTQQAVWARKNGLYLSMCETDNRSEIEFPRDVKLIYMAVQHAFRNRPEVFLHSEVRTPVVNSKSKNKKARHETKKFHTVKIIHINYEELIRVPSTTHYQMTCPCWGVAGHWRNYQSGKRIWIKPYRKGAERDNAEKYLPKSYAIYEEVSAHA
jgi:hypothetical protein